MHSKKMKKDEFERLLDIMEALRGEQGCEWDKKQTHKTLKPYAVEEAYEVAEAIDNNDTEELKGELGDLLLQTVFHSQIGSENDEFDIYDVLQMINDKMIRRHPHVFKDKNKYTYSYKQWEDIKAAEKGKKAETRIGKINKALPSLSMARRVQENAAEVGFDWEKTEQAMEKIDEELSELKAEIELGNSFASEKREEIPEGGKQTESDTAIEEEFGDLLFAVVNVARFLKIDPEMALRKATDKFIKRFRQMEKRIEDDSEEFEKLGLKELDKYWELIKESGV